MCFLFLLHRNAFETHTMFKTLSLTTWINFSRSFLLRSSCDQCFGWGLQCSGQLAPRWSKASSARLALWKVIPLPSGSWSVITEREKRKEEGRPKEWETVLLVRSERVLEICFLSVQTLPTLPSYLPSTLNIPSLFRLFPHFITAAITTVKNSTGSRGTVMSWRQPSISEGERLKGQEEQQTCLWVSYPIR